MTSPGWKRGLRQRRNPEPDPESQGHYAQRIAIVTTAVIYVQILLGATMRHTGAGLAIPDFPLAFGHLIPPHWDPKIAMHFAHRVGALIVTLLDPRDDRPRLLSPSAAARSCGVRRFCCWCCSPCRSRSAR